MSILCNNFSYKNLDNIKAVIFDMDGTLIDSLHVWSDIDVEYLGMHGIEVPPDDYSRVIDGMSFKQVAEYTKKRFNIPDSVETIMDTWNKMAEKKYSYEVDFKPGAKFFLEYCHNKGLKMGIATSNSRFLVEKLCDRLGLINYFDVIITGDEVVNGKPAPDIYLTVAEALGVKPGYCLVFEDVLAGIEAGRSAGMKVCAVHDEHSVIFEQAKINNSDYFLESYLMITD